MEVTVTLGVGATAFPHEARKMDKRRRWDIRFMIVLETPHPERDDSLSGRLPPLPLGEGRVRVDYCAAGTRNT